MIIYDIFKKEVIDILRDRRALVVMVIVPIFLYPVLIGGLTELQKRQQERLAEQQVTIQVAGEAPDPGLHQALTGVERMATTTHPDPREAVKQGDLDAFVLLEGAPPQKPTVRIFYNSSRDTSNEAFKRLSFNLIEFQKGYAVARAIAEGIDATKLTAVAGIEQEDLGKGGGILGRMLAMFLVIMAVSGAMYPALDLGAGEKERGTLETILAAPVKRSQIVMGKYLATSAIALGTAFVNVVVMALTFKWLASASASQVGISEITIGWDTFVVLTAVLIPLVLLFSALALALSTFARSYKEAQSYVTPLIVVGTIPAVLAMAPGIDLNTGFAVTPVLGTVLLFRDLLAGLATPWHVSLVLGSTCLYAGLALIWPIRLYHHEGVLFRT